MKGFAGLGLGFVRLEDFRLLEGNYYGAYGHTLVPMQSLGNTSMSKTVSAKKGENHDDRLVVFKAIPSP